MTNNQELTSFEFSADYDAETQSLYVASESSSGCKYSARNKKEIIDGITDYILYYTTEDDFCQDSAYISAIYSPTKSRDPVADRILKYVYEHQDEFTFVAGRLKTGKGGAVLLCREDFKKCRPKFQSDQEVLDYLDALLAGNIRHCNCCGSYTMNAAQSYRSNAGVVSKTSECSLCICADERLYSKIQNRCALEGTHESAKYAFSVLFPSEKGAI